MEGVRGREFVDEAIGPIVGLASQRELCSIKKVDVSWGANLSNTFGWRLNRIECTQRSTVFGQRRDVLVSGKFFNLTAVEGR
jgi:hypothetical protein